MKKYGFKSAATALKSAIFRISSAEDVSFALQDLLSIHIFGIGRATTPLILSP